MPLWSLVAIGALAVAVAALALLLMHGRRADYQGPFGVDCDRVRRYPWETYSEAAVDAVLAEVGLDFVPA